MPAILTTWVLPIGFVVAVAGVLMEVIRGGGRSAIPSRLACVPLVFCAGDALVGDHRPLMERVWKGVGVALLAIAYLWAWWRTWRAQPGRFRQRSADRGGAGRESAAGGA